MAATDKNYAQFAMSKLSRKNIAAMKKRCEHTNRTDHAENVNKELSAFNRCVIGQDGADWYQLFQQRYAESEYYRQPDARKLYANAVLGFEVVVGMSSEFCAKVEPAKWEETIKQGASPQELFNVDIDAWVAANNDWMKQHFGEGNVLHGVLHYCDEASGPHIHYFVTPMSEDGRFIASEIMGNKKDMSERQTEYAKAMEPFGLRRGLKGIRMKNESICDLYTKTESSVKNLPTIEDGETLEEYYERVNKQYRSVQYRNQKLERDLDRNEKVEVYSYKLEEQLESERQSHAAEIAKLSKEHDAVLSEERKKAEEQIQQLKDRKIGSIKVENIIAAIEYYPDKAASAAFVESMETNLKEWDEVGAYLLAQHNEERTGNEDIDDMSERK